MDTEAPLELQAIYAPIREEMRQLEAFLEEEFASVEPFIGDILEHIARFRGKQIRPALLFLVARVARVVGGREAPAVAGPVVSGSDVRTAGVLGRDVLRPHVIGPGVIGPGVIGPGVIGPGVIGPGDLQTEAFRQDGVGSGELATDDVGSGDPTPDLVKIAGVIELIHTATLVHDDILDDAHLRRKVETVHRRWGERAAVLIGDFIYSRAFHLSTQVAGMAGILAETTNTICEGELLQIETRHRAIDEATYLEIIRKKTAVLYAAACHIGGLLGGLDAARCRTLHDFGLNLGMAFQIADDCLDYAGKESVTGKSLGSDLRQGKVTMPLVCLLESAPEEERRLVEGVLRGPITPKAEEWIRTLVETHGALDDAFSRAAAFVQVAKDVLAGAFGGDGFGGDSGAFAVRESLELVAEYLVRRQQ